MGVKRLLRLLLILSCLASFPLLAQPDGGSDDWDDWDDDWDDDIFLIADPLEAFNRAMFAFNDRLYFLVLKPVARVYRVVPTPVRTSTRNFFSNLRAPIRITNSLFQLKLVDAGNELLRFGVNSTIGIGGLFDPARKYLGIRQKSEDFGQTLGRYGVGHGFYLVAPVYGPTSLRDGTGALFDGYFLDPVVFLVDDYWQSAGLMTFEGINTLSLDRDTYEAIKRDALDPYVFIRDAYAQSRAAEVAR
jgi:phospholipid-binding lipoprotein MlaA